MCGAEVVLTGSPAEDTHHGQRGVYPVVGEACCEVLSLSSSVVENRAGRHSRQKTRPEGSGHHGTARAVSLVAQSGAASQAADRLVFSAGPADSTGAAATRRLPRRFGGRTFAAVCRAGRLPADNAAVANSVRPTILRGENSSGRSLQRRLRPPDDPVRKLCSRSLLAGRLTLGRLGSRLGGAGLGLGGLCCSRSSGLGRLCCWCCRRCCRGLCCFALCGHSHVPPWGVFDTEYNAGCSPASGANNREIKGCDGVNRPRQFQPDNVIGQPHKMRQVENLRSTCSRESLLPVNQACLTCAQPKCCGKQPGFHDPADRSRPAQGLPGSFPESLWAAQGCRESRCRCGE